MRAIMCLGAVLFLASCDDSKQQLANTQATLSGVTRERDDLKAKVVSLQDQLNTAKAELAQVKSVPPPATTAVAAKAPEGKSASSTPSTKAPKAKHDHKS